MKTLLLLPMFILLIACGNEEEPLSGSTKLVDEAVEMLIFNKEILEDEVMFGVLCLAEVTETGSKKNDMCHIYYLTQEQATKMTVVGLKIFETLYASGSMQDEGVYLEVIDIIDRLATVEIQAKALRKKIDDLSGSGCIKCAM